MPEMSTKYVPKHMGDKNPNPRLLKFVRRVTTSIESVILETSNVYSVKKVVSLKNFFNSLETENDISTEFFRFFILFT